MPSHHTSRLSAYLRAALPEERRAEVVAASCEDVLERLWRRARERWPEIELDEALFFSFIAERLPDDGTLETALERCNVDDLYLACACLDGNERAAQTFTRLFFPEIRRAVAALGAAQTLADEVGQEIYAKLFVGDGSRRPKIQHYSGRGQLLTWIRVVATRQAIDLLRAEAKRGDAPNGLLEDRLVATVEDPELAWLKERYRPEFKLAFEDALSALDSRDRNLLRHQILSRLTLPEIASIYHVDRATIVRWLRRTRERLLVATREGLMHRLQIDQQAFDSVIRLLGSQLDASIQRLLGDED